MEALRPSGGNEYLLILLPHADLRNRILQARRELSDKYGLPASSARPYVSLMIFRAPESLESKLAARVQQIAMAQAPFVVELRDYGSYPMHSLFLRIANQQRVVQLIKALKELRPLLKQTGSDPYFLSDPVVPLAGKIGKEDYLTIMKEYLHKKFSARFVADCMVLMKRTGPGTLYQLVRRFEFQHLPVQQVQGHLF